jgi:hypothetical protein
MEQELIINTDWINNEMRLFNENGVLHQELMKTIQIIHVHINSSSEVIKTRRVLHSFDNGDNLLSSNEIFRYYVENRNIDSIQYKFFKLLVYNVDLGDKLYTTINSISTINFLKSFTHIKDIIINPSLFIFHEINAVYLIYKENIKNCKNITLKNRRT